MRNLLLPAGTDPSLGPIHDPSLPPDADESLSDLLFDAEVAQLPALVVPPETDGELGFSRVDVISGVPFTRIVRLGMHGADVIAYKRTLSRAGFMQWGKFTDFAGPNFGKAVSNFRHAHGLGKEPSVGPKTHVALTLAYKKGSRSERAMDANARSILETFHKTHSKTPEQLRREAIVAEWHFLWTIRYQMPYVQYRPTALVRPPQWPHPGTDCSGMITEGYWNGGAPNPNFFNGQRLPYNGQGYTGTIMAAGTRCSFSDLELADVIMYGSTTRASGAFPVGSPTHVAGYAGNNSVYSNGSYPMRYDTLHYRGDVNCYIHLEV